MRPQAALVRFSVVLTFEVTVPELELEHVNERETVQAMGDVICASLKSRLSSGFGANVALKPPKDGGQALHRTGSLANSIAVEVVEKRGELVAIVKPTGDRPASENTGDKAKRARAKTKELRAATSIGLIFATLGGGTVDSHFVRAQASKSGEVFKLSKIRVRAATTNAALAGILSVPPRDKRGVNGGRAEYRLFDASPLYEQIAQVEAQKVARFVLKAV